MYKVPSSDNGARAAQLNRWAIVRTSANEGDRMKLDIDRIDEVVLALLCLGLHDGARAWKSFDWDAMGRLHQKGFITDPVGKAKSVTFTESGLRESQRLLEALFVEK